MVKSFLKILISIKFHLLWFLVVSLFCYATVLVPPEVFWPASLMSYAIPVILVGNLLLLVFTAIFNRKHMIYPTIGILLGLSFVQDTFTWSKQADHTENHISVLSYNVKLFREYDTYDRFSKELIDWVIHDSSDVKCIQEFSTNEKWSQLNTSANIKKHGYVSYEYVSDMMDPEHNLGMAIFSKLPIVNKGMLWSEKDALNGGMFVDLIRDKDTIRIYNVHLESMRLGMPHFKKRDIFGKVSYLLGRFKLGAIKRSEQIKILAQHTSACKLPYIIVGDFNETPYSFNYYNLSQHYLSSFDAAGKGFDFSHNGLLFFLRIDHQFYSTGLSVAQYEVDQTIKISDHFPTRAWYTLSE